MRFQGEGKKFTQPIGFRHLIVVEEGYPFPGS
jgi:hypothetical protein